MYLLAIRISSCKLFLQLIGLLFDVYSYSSLYALAIKLLLMHTWQRLSPIPKAVCLLS